jgi:hypothetical protein
LGFLPVRLDFHACDIAFETRPDFEEAVTSVKEEDRIEGDWVYAPPQQRKGDRRLVELPYASRVFVLPKNAYYQPGRQ